jgi:hypothetical protein
VNPTNSSKFWGVVLTLGLTAAALIFLFGMMEESRGFNNPMPVFAALVGGGIFFGLIRGPIGKAIAKMLDGPGVPDEHTVMRIEQLEDRLAELGLDQQRMAELEERLDFAERLLASREAMPALRRPEDR